MTASVLSPMDHQRIALCVETLCTEGCNDVRSAIKRIEAGQPVPQLEGLSESECAAVLAELKSIMAVYDRK